MKHPKIETQADLIDIGRKWYRDHPKEELTIELEPHQLFNLLLTTPITSTAYVSFYCLAAEDKERINFINIWITKAKD